MKKRTKAQEQIWTSDQLPDGMADERYLRVDKEWPNLENRLGQPRILQHRYIGEVLRWIGQKDNPDDFTYLDAGCGHGNDLRAIRQALGNRGRFFGVTLSRAEIIRGLEFYRKRDNENTSESIKLFGLGDLQDLGQILIWDKLRGTFSCPKIIENGEVDLVYMEAVLQASGYGHNTYQGKKESARQILSELSHVCKTGGKFLGRAMAFVPTISKEQQLAVLRKNNNWQFIPEFIEFTALLKEAKFCNLKISVRPHEKAAIDLSRKDVVKISFLAEKQ